MTEAEWLDGTAPAAIGTPRARRGEPSLRGAPGAAWPGGAGPEGRTLSPSRIIRFAASPFGA